MRVARTQDKRARVAGWLACVLVALALLPGVTMGTEDVAAPDDATVSEGVALPAQASEGEGEVSLGVEAAPENEVAIPEADAPAEALDALEDVAFPDGAPGEAAAQEFGDIDAAETPMPADASSPGETQPSEAAIPSGEETASDEAIPADTVVPEAVPPADETTPSDNAVPSDPVAPAADETVVPGETAPADTVATPDPVVPTAGETAAPSETAPSDPAAAPVDDPVVLVEEEVIYEPWADYARVDDDPYGVGGASVMLFSARGGQSAVSVAEGLIRDAILTFSATVEIDPGLGLTRDMAREAFSNVTYGDPELYYVAPSFSIAYDGSTGFVRLLTLRYIVNQAELPAYSAAVEQGVQRALAWVDGSMTELEMVQAVHDYLVRTIVYTETGSYTPVGAFSDTGYRTSEVYTVYGALVSGRAVCQGYANAFKLLMNRLGVGCVFVPSQSMVHAWNMVQVDGAWYHIDATWDDHAPSPDDPDAGFYDAIDRQYYLKSDATFSSSAHYGWSAAYYASTDAAIDTWPEYVGPTDPSVPDVSAGWSQSGTCEWQLSGDALVVRPLAGGQSGTLGKATSYTQPWQYATPSIASAAFLEGVSLRDDAASLFGGAAPVVKCPAGSAVAAYAQNDGMTVAYLALGLTPDVYVVPIQEEWPYTGSAVEPELEVHGRLAPLQNGADFTVAYADNVSPGSATAKIAGKGAYAGSATFGFAIVGEEPAEKDEPADPPAPEDQTPAPVNPPSPAVPDPPADPGTPEDADPDPAPAPAKKTSIATATVSLDRTGFTYDGSAHKPAVTVKLGRTTLRQGVDYTVGWPANPVYGSQTVRIDGTGAYTGSVTASYGIWFSDTPRGAWYMVDGWLDYVVANNVMTGIKSADGSHTGAFDPDGAVTRGQVATVLYRYANPSSKATTDRASYGRSKTFSDVASGMYYTAAIEWCYANGIVTGYSGTGRFGPEDPVTREQLATMLYRFARYLGKDVSHTERGVRSKADASAISVWAFDAVCWCFDEGIMTGHAHTGLLDPAGTATRAQTAKMLTMLLDR